jgi:hypothetical protein
MTPNTAAPHSASVDPLDDRSGAGGHVQDREEESRDRLIDAARTDVVFLAERGTGLTEALDRLDQQAYGDADRLRGAAEQLRRRFSGADAIPLLEAAAEHAQTSTEPDPPAAVDLTHPYPYPHLH